MKEKIYVAAIAILAILNIIQFVQTDASTKQTEVRAEGNIGPGDTVEDDIHWAYAGCYTYPGFGMYLVPSTPDGKSEKAPLTLAIFLTSATTCPAVLSETEVFRRLIPALRERGQQTIGVCSPGDSVAVAEFLRTENLDIPLKTLEAEADDGRKVPLMDMGISHYFMPFKVLYDSSLTSIYVRGADNTPESRADFERTVMRLSDLVKTGKL
ncbi:MAG: hypothetical protein WBP29_09405 [Candidatus Zixiibacteriota bacterium]